MSSREARRRVREKRRTRRERSEAPKLLRSSAFKRFDLLGMAERVSKIALFILKIEIAKQTSAISQITPSCARRGPYQQNRRCRRPPSPLSALG